MDWDTLHANLEAACGDGGSDAVAEQAVAAAEIVASAAGEPPDELPGRPANGSRRTASPRTSSSSSPAGR